MRQAFVTLSPFAARCDGKFHGWSYRSSADTGTVHVSRMRKNASTHMCNTNISSSESGVSKYVFA